MYKFHQLISNYNMTNYSFKYSLIILSLLVIVTSCKKEEIPSHTIDEKTIRVADNNYYYAIAVPHDFNELKDYPLILALHWGNAVDFQSGVNFLNSLIFPPLEDFDGIILSPSCPESAGWIHENSELFIFTLLEKIKTDYNVDTSKVAIMGYSMGGTGTWYYASEFTNIFSLAIPMASMPPNYLLPITDINPTYVIHGTEDELVSLQKVKDLVRDIKINNNTIRLVEVKDASHYETNKYKKPLSETLDWIEDKWYY